MQVVDWLALIDELYLNCVERVNFSKMFCCFCSCKLTSQMTNEKNFTMQTLVQICAKTAQTKCMMLRLLLNIAPDIFYIIRNGKNIVVVFILKSLSTDDMGRSHLDVSNSSSIRGEFLKMIVGRAC